MIPHIDSELKALIPQLTLEERQQLEQNICQARKCHDAIILWNGIILDGHNRFEICMEHGIEFQIKEMDFDSREEAKLWMLENQLGRRNLSQAARIELALLKEGTIREKARKKQSDAGGDRTSSKYKGALLPKKTTQTDDAVHVQNDLAHEASVGKGSFCRYMDIIENGTPQLIEAVKSGKMKIGTAHRLLPKQMLKELREASKMYKFIAEHISFVTDEKKRAEINKGLDRLAGMLKIMVAMTSKKPPQSTLP